MVASKIQRPPAAIQSAGLWGTASNVKEARMAPIRKYGRRRPNLECHVLSLIWPIIGWTIRPVKGAAIHNNGRLCSSAPKVSKILLIKPP